MPEPRYALIILDGLADRVDPTGREPTPLALARTPHLDRLAAEGQTGQVMIIGPGVAPESDAGVLSLLGYDPIEDSPGRGVLEALGAEVPLGPGDVAFRLNFATADDAGRVVDARVGRNLSTAEASELAAALTAADLLRDEHVRAEVRPTVGHRGVLWLHPLDGRALSGEVTNSDPFYERIGKMGAARSVADPRVLEVRPLADTDGARRTARVVNRFGAGAAALLPGQPVNTRRRAAGKPIGNVLLLRNAGDAERKRTPAFHHKHGRAGSAVTEMPVERGIARWFELEDRFVGPMGPDRAQSLRERATSTREALRTSPFVYVHLKGPDEPGHDGRADLKQEVIEALDAWFFGPFLEGLDRASVRIAITADHATPATLRGHSDDPVPLLLWGSGVVPSGIRSKFSEEACASKGRLGLRSAREVLPLLFALTVAPA